MSSARGCINKSTLADQYKRLSLSQITTPRLRAHEFAGSLARSSLHHIESSRREKLRKTERMEYYPRFPINSRRESLPPAVSEIDRWRREEGGLEAHVCCNSSGGEMRAWMARGEMNISGAIRDERLKWFWQRVKNRR